MAAVRKFRFSLTRKQRAGSFRLLRVRRRAAYTMRYANADTVQVNPDEHRVPVYLVRGDAGENASQYIDSRPGRALPDPIET